MSATPSLPPLPGAPSLSARDVLHAAWPLFKVSLPGCLPLAVIGVAASGTPGAEAATSGEGHGFLHDRQWWALYVVSTVLTLVCYAAILRQQLARSRGDRPLVMDSMRQSLIGILPTGGVVILCMVIVVAGSLLLLLPGIAAAIWLFFAWVAQIDERLGPVAALRRSIDLVRGRFLAVAAIFGASIAAVLVFVLLTSILLNIVTNLAGRGMPATHTGLSLSRWLLAALLSLPVCYMGAVTVSAWNVARQRAGSTPAS